MNNITIKLSDYGIFDIDSISLNTLGSLLLDSCFNNGVCENLQDIADLQMGKELWRIPTVLLPNNHPKSKRVIGKVLEDKIQVLVVDYDDTIVEELPFDEKLEESLNKFCLAI